MRLYRIMNRAGKITGGRTHTRPREAVVSKRNGCDFESGRDVVS